MDRLTQTSDKGGLAFTFDLDVSCSMRDMRKIVALGERLKAYEDTKLTPEEIERIKNLAPCEKYLPPHEGENNTDWPECELQQYFHHIPIDRLREICDAERDERLVVLPCKVGDTVYRIEEYHCCTNPDWDSSEVIEDGFGLEDIACFGTTVFLTREAAEAAMKGE